MSFKVGDKVKIREDLICGNLYHEKEVVIEEMLKYAGESATIRRIVNEDLYILSCDPEEWYWPEKTLLPVIETNAAKIRNMDDKTMAKFLCEKFCHDVGKDLILDWLRRENDD